MTSILKVDNIKDSANNQAISISGGVATFSSIPVGTNVTGSAAFAARVTGTTWNTAGDGVIIPYNNDSTNDSFDTDGVYNTTTYKFVAPATGVYMFWYAIYTANADTENSFGFLKNTARLNMASSTNSFFSYIGATSGDHMQQATIVVPLASGDTMAHIATVASDYYTGNTQWGGCRLA